MTCSGQLQEEDIEAQVINQIPEIISKDFSDGRSKESLMNNIAMKLEDNLEAEFQLKLKEETGDDIITNEEVVKELIDAIINEVCYYNKFV